ncbi:MAG: hypothetical protein AB7P33_00815 [Dehalococcoidia bacterium]
MAKKPPSQVPPERLAQYEALVATLPEVERKGASMPYTSVNGNMFSFLDPAGVLGLRLSKDDREAFIARFETELMLAQGRVMQEYVRVPDSMLADTAATQPYFEASYNYVSGLKPKATIRKRA